MNKAIITDGPGAEIPSGQVSCFTETVDENLILQRMKEIETEHNANVKDCPDLPQFAQFLPIEKV